MFEINNECVICDNGYDLYESKCLPKLGKCLQLTQFNLCSRCQERLFLDKSGQCIDLKCAKWDYYSCLECLPGFKKSHDGICEDSNCITIK